MAHLLHSCALWLQTGYRRLQSTSAWQYTGGKRDLRLDFLRGFAVCAMLIDHLGGEPSWFYLITGGNHFFVSVAELFVAISGFLVGTIYVAIVAKHGLGTALRKCLQRAGKLYVLTVLLTLGYAGLALLLGFGWAPPLSAATWPDFVFDVMMLHRTFEMTDILLLYTLLMLGTLPVLCALAHGYTTPVLAGSWGLWLLWQCAPQYANIPWPIAANTIFHFSSWQVLFLTALVMGYHRRSLAQLLGHVKPHTVLLGSGLLVAGILGLYTWEPTSPALAALLAQGFDKPNLALGRLLAFASFFSFALALVTLAWRPLVRGLGWLLLPLGQRALPAYTLHLVVLAGGLKAYPALLGSTPPSVWHNMLMQGLGVVCLWGLLTMQPRLAAYYQPVLHLQPLLLSLRRFKLYTLGAGSAALVLALLYAWSPRSAGVPEESPPQAMDSTLQPADSGSASL